MKPEQHQTTLDFAKHLSSTTMTFFASAASSVSLRGKPLGIQRSAKDAYQMAMMLVKHQ